MNGAYCILRSETFFFLLLRHYVMLGYGVLIENWVFHLSEIDEIIYMKRKTQTNYYIVIQSRYKRISNLYGSRKRLAKCESINTLSNGNTNFFASRFWTGCYCGSHSAHLFPIFFCWIHIADNCYCEPELPHGTFSVKSNWMVSEYRTDLSIF